MIQPIVISQMVSKIDTWYYIVLLASRNSLISIINMYHYCDVQRMIQAIVISQMVFKIDTWHYIVLLGSRNSFISIIDMYHYCDGTTVQHYVLKIDICLLGGRNSIHLKRNLIQVQKPLICFNDAETFSAFCSSLMNLGGLTHERVCTEEARF